MNSLSVLLSLLLASVLTYAAPAASGENAVDNTPKEPPNEWGTYYILPNKFDQMKQNFKDAYTSYQKNPSKETECKANDADFERWFQSSKDKTLYILSYYCRTKSARGYEHLQVYIRPGNSISVKSFEDSLKNFGIMDAGDYDNTKSGKEALKIQEEKLEQVREQIKEQRNPYDQDEDLCPDAGTQTLYEVKTKIQNGLYYYKFPISCNHSGSGYDKMAWVEVVEDKDFKVLNEGNATLIAMEDPEDNIEFKREKEKELAAKQGSASSLVPTVITLVLLPLAHRMF